MVEGEHFFPCTKKHQLIMAAHNYLELKRELFQHDIGPRALYRVLLEKYLDLTVTPELMRDFFANITDENCGRAIRMEGALTYQECNARWTALSQTNVHRVAGELAKRNASREERIAAGEEDTAYTGHKAKRQRIAKNGGGGGNFRNNEKVKDPPYCGNFNKPPGCSNDKVMFMNE